MMKKLNKKETSLFLSLCLPMIKTSAGEDIKGRLYYALKHGGPGEKDLEAAFPKEYAGVLEKIQEKPFLGFLSRRNYVLDYFFNGHNKNGAGCPIMLASVIGFKAERIKGEKMMTAMVKYGNGETEKSSLEVFPHIAMHGLNLHDKVLVHCSTICHKLSENELQQINQYSLP